MKLLNVETTTTTTTTFEYSKNIHFVVTKTNEERTFELKNTQEGKERYHPRLVRNGVFEWLKTHNPFTEYDETMGEVFRDFIVNTFEEYENTVADNTTLLFVCSYDHTIYLEDYTPVPFQLKFNYLSGYCSSENLEIGNSVHVLNQTENVSDVSVTQVEYYNQNDKGDLMSLNFSFLPTVEMLQHIQNLEKTQTFVDRKLQIVKLLGLYKTKKFKDYEL